VVIEFIMILIHIGYFIG